MATGTATKKKLAKPAKKQWDRPFTIELEVIFEDPNRRVTMGDLHETAEQVAVKAREFLTDYFDPAYKVAEVKWRSEYRYSQGVEKGSA